MKKYKLHIVWAIIAVAALVGGIFWGKGMGSASATRTGFTGVTGRTGTTRAGGGISAGQVTAIDSNSFTLQLANGNSENVYYSSSTQAVTTQTSSLAALKTGSMVMVVGTQNSDGSVTARSIQVGGSGFGGGFGGRGAAAGSTGGGSNTGASAGTGSPTPSY